jgi:hypothetical protein
MSLRNLTRVSATAVLAAGALALSAAPALAADVDFGLTLTGTTIAADATGKLGSVNITNHGTTKPKEVNVTFDATKLDDSKIEIELGGECEFDADKIARCSLYPEDIPGAGGTAEMVVPLTRQDGASGAAGKLTITVDVPGDSNKSNNSRTVDVNVGGNGVDLRVIAPDVTGVDQQSGEPTGKAVNPGEISVLYALVWNEGDRIADGLRVDVKLPKQVTFAAEAPDCDYAADKRSARCEYKDFSLLPADRDTTGKDSSAGFFFPVQLSEDAKGPAALSGGEVTVTAIDQSSALTAKRLKEHKSVRPANAKALTAAQAALEVDASDNTDPYAVLVAGATGGSGGGDEEPGLPVTGPVAATAAGLGAVVLAAGAFLFVSARRRRVVLVTPADGK